MNFKGIKWTFSQFNMTKGKLKLTIGKGENTFLKWGKVKWTIPGGRGFLLQVRPKRRRMGQYQWR